MLTDAAYSRFVTPGQKPGFVVVGLDRTPFCGGRSQQAPKGRVTISVGRLVINANHQPSMGKVEHTVFKILPNCAERDVRIPVGPPPWRVQVHLNGTFVPSEWTDSPDSRTLGARIGFRYAAR